MAEAAESVLDERERSALAERHRQRLDAVLGPLLRRARCGDPVPRFLFSYYGLRPGQLRCWHPGFGVALAGEQAVRAYRDRRGYAVAADRVAVSSAYLHSRRDTVRFVARLLRATAGRPAQLNCFGLHEWAMVYRSGEVRHQRIPLRLNRSAVDTVVETGSIGPLRCTHFDAHRFFTADFTTRFVPDSSAAPSRSTQVDWEQPGCLHANMDLFKWCYKLIPLVDSTLLLDCLELAAAAREVDMRASPYDLSGFGYAPIAVEDAAGRAEYVRCQSAVAERAAPLRATLLERCDLLLRVAECG